ncbi:MAG: hypothetical protein GXO09_06070 [Crenarchaeota archaeon]|nr:hypothetical protein [Thermoproteota archaeon]
MIPVLVFWGLVGVAVASTFQFFRGRRRNLRILEESVKALEAGLRPVDKEYTMVGLYVGYTAEYRLRDSLVPKAYAAVTTLPRQSLLYMPFSLATRRYDRIYLVYDLSLKPPGEAHLVRKYTYLLGDRRAGVHGPLIGVRRVDGYTYRVYGDERLAERLLEGLRLLGARYVRHLAAYPEPPRLFIHAQLPHERGELERLAETGLRLARRVASMA